MTAKKQINDKSWSKLIRILDSLFIIILIIIIYLIISSMINANYRVSHFDELKSELQNEKLFNAMYEYDLWIVDKYFKPFNSNDSVNISFDESGSFVISHIVSRDGFTLFRICREDSSRVFYGNKDNNWVYIEKEPWFA
jgi:hypothetical protein